MVIYPSLDLLVHAMAVYGNNFPRETCFERAIFFSWGCSLGDCGFCYMSTQPEHKLVRETRRSESSVLAEFLLAKHLGWDIGFFTGGIGAYGPLEIESLLRKVHAVTKEKIWLSIGPITGSLLKKYQPYIRGVVGSTETINPALHKKVCPSKPLWPYEKMFEEAKKLGLSRAMTFIVGLGETPEDFHLLKGFINKYEINKIHVYSLIPIKGTMFAGSLIPSKEAQAWWIANLRVSFPSLNIQCGIWEDRIERISHLLNAGANSISKFKAIKHFGTPLAAKIENQAELAGRKFKGTLTRVPDWNWNREIDEFDLAGTLKEQVKKKLANYIKEMKKNSGKL